MTRIPPGLLLTIGMLTVFGPLCIDLYLPALPDITRELHAGPSSTQLSLTACLVGLAAGQLFFGPLSDQLGRRRPLFSGLVLFVLASVACSLAPAIEVLIAFRFLEGFGGGAGIVIARAVVRDLFSGATAARFFSLLMLVTGLGPILAPQLGALLLGLGPWRGLFLGLAVAGVALIAVSALRVEETLAPHDRVPLEIAATVRSFMRVGRNPAFLANALATGLGMGAIFAYISGSSYVLENVYRLSPSQYSLAFGVNAVFLVLGSQVSGHLVQAVGSRRLLTMGLSGLCAAASLLLLLDLAGLATLPLVLGCMTLVMFFNGFVGPNAVALAMNDLPDVAGAAAALIGVFQFAIGGVTAPLVGIGGTHDLTPMVAVMAFCALTAVLVRVILRPRQPAQGTCYLSGPSRQPL